MRSPRWFVCLCIPLLYLFPMWSVSYEIEVHDYFFPERLVLVSSKILIGTENGKPK
jgi:hypothetical protein